MSALSSVAAFRGGIVTPSFSNLERRLRRFDPDVRPAVYAIATQHRYLADLAKSYPGLLFSLAVPASWSSPARNARTGQAAAAITRGESIDRAASLIGLPRWLRALPPEAYRRPLGTLPTSDFFRVRIANLLPKRRSQAAAWLETVMEAAEWGDETYALWTARVETRDKNPFLVSRRYRRDRRNLALWAWYSQRPATVAGVWCERRWQPTMGGVGAIGEARAWKDRVDLELELAGLEIADLWLEPGEALGYHFVPLATVSAIDDEARRMDHCIRTYGDCVALGQSRLWSIEQDGRPVASLELATGRSRAPIVKQLRGIRNAAVDDDVWVAVHTWIRAQPFRLIDVPDRPLAYQIPLDRLTWQRVWRPYWLEKRRIPSWLPLSATAGDLYAI
ncbi:PcfJ domain-containing protein [Chthonobacter albigriseus]|uniref:PcfJ domain-containing protein n=1 Tax=Chthonobacter albigriseus TaxID=1683161 RepID=UPI0015EEF4D9|nr:PcfJ domain-containing protein [Chthonobacter albigriseus]